MREIEKVEKVEAVKSARFKVRLDSSSTLEALKKFLAAASCAFDPMVITIRRGSVCGYLEVEIHNADVEAYYVVASEVRPAFDGDEWGEFVYSGDVAVLIRIRPWCFLAFDGRLRAFTEEEAEEELRKLNLLSAQQR